MLGLDECTCGKACIECDNCFVAQCECECEDGEAVVDKKAKGPIGGDDDDDEDGADDETVAEDDEDGDGEAKDDFGAGFKDEDDEKDPNY